MDGALIITMPDGSEWAVPIRIIAEHRSLAYAHEYDGDATRALLEDTIPLFDCDSYEIRDWAANNMNWSDVQVHAKIINPPSKVDYEEGWWIGPYRVER